ncbi:MAG: hypothetical protein A4E57_03370 [Syntrophorhabdaceae bacterium PtaU1.Bin034]|nr:MAG: hypothetical protein A4E57_03370 [Syntrophorhabdaceae bacterium PtaU1.Bin034]
MWYTQKIDPLLSVVNGKYISFVGGGGKTSLAEFLAGQALEKGKRVVITTTTKIRAKEPCIRLDRQKIPGGSGGDFIRVGKSVENEKLTGLDEDEIKAIAAHYDLVLIEADGAKGQPLKYPASYEPIIPSFSDRIVVVAGLDGLSGQVREKVFRWELLLKATGIVPDMRVTADIFVRLFGEDALMKGVDKAKCAVFLNKYDACHEREKVLPLARAVSEKAGDVPVVVGSVRHGIFCNTVRLG